LQLHPRSSSPPCFTPRATPPQESK
jgi:hypothetical protein